MNPGRILLFGGSFDPPHNGHLSLLKCARKTIKPERTYLLPAWRSPLKGPSAVPARTRLELLRLALREGADPESESLRIDPFELERGRTTYTYEAVREMRRRHPGAKIFFLAGSDSLKNLHLWRRPEELRRSCTFAAGMRPGHPTIAEKDLDFIRLPGTFPAVSSTQVRVRLLCGLDTSSTLASSVLARIRTLGLYGTGLNRTLGEELPARRFHHTLGVARIAAELAGLYGLDPERAALTGLLHDCARAMSPKQLVHYARRQQLHVPAIEEIVRRKPALLHAYVGEHLCRHRFGIRDPEILSAVRKHTLGDPHMSTFDRLLYVADACSEERRYAEAYRIRRLARKSLAEGFQETVRIKLAWVLRSADWMHPFGPALWNQAIAR
ncbi:MAG: bis(5'-nucleosyl)-tetraphosphatase (symmetrical) YqeK [Elusimicrobiota bacterium]|jgi:nicotinate-nucleotide adenylyltransferase